MSHHPAFAEDLRDVVDSFIVETREIFDDLHDDLLRLENEEDRTGLIDKIFRGVHTVKGTSSFLGLDQLNQLAHHYEDALSRLRKEGIAYQPGTTDVLLAAYDRMCALLQQVVDQRIEPIRIGDIVERLTEISDTDGPDPSPDTPAVDMKCRLYSSEPGTDAVPVQPTDPPAGAAMRPARRAARRPTSIRVDIEQLDDLIALVGELAVNRTHLAHVISKLEGKPGIRKEVTELVETTQRLESVTSELRSTVLKTRMVPIERVFGKFPRLASDLGKTVSKSIEVVLGGVDTEVEKSLADELGEPLLHLIRNAIDHGIEPRHVRAARGKPEEGRIVLEARQEDTFVAICVEDDGAGIDPDTIRKKAVESRMLTQAEATALDDKAVYSLIWRPGFTTTEKVNRLSGRGVGLDVVHTAVSRLNGTIETESAPGSGTRFTLRLPITLAARRSLLIGCDGEIYALPLAHVIDVAAAGPQLRRGGRADLREESYEPIYLADALGLSRPSHADTLTAVVQVDGTRYGLIFDRLHGREDIVVRPFDSRVVSTTGAAGSAVLADGRSIMVLDVDSVVAASLERLETAEDLEVDAA